MLSIVVIIISQLAFVTSENCVDFVSCGQCIGSSLENSWCLDEIYNGTRCVSSKDLSTKPSAEPWCLHPYNPPSKEPILDKDDKFSDKIQLRPQHVDIEARPGDTVNFDISYKPAKDYPIDIYYLFDNSYSMNDHKKKLIAQAEEIYQALYKLTNNVQFGAGSFVEKLALPFADKNKHELNTFNNHLSLTNDIKRFVETIKKVKYTSNYEPQEAGLDALMQVMTCWQQIKWRKNARRMIILSTDASYHSAGDGRAVGAFRPNDKQCHLNSTPDDPISDYKYDEAALIYDYPSVSQINEVANDKDISIFFATLRKVKKEFKALAASIKLAKYVELKDDKQVKNDLVKLIVEEYKTLSQGLELFVSNVPSHVQVTLSPECKGRDDPDKSKCVTTIDKPSVNISINVHVKSCPTVRHKTDDLTIKAIGTDDKVVVRVNAICQCECEIKNGEHYSDKCEKRGTYQCGVCQCGKGWYGENCSCGGVCDPNKCKLENAKVDCNGQGYCRCGRCQCSQGYNGKYCEYDMSECPRVKGTKEICANHGTCEEGKCNCSPGWEGADCSCSTDKSTCVGFNSEVCSGRGTCKCRACRCKDGYTGKYCELCDTCVEERCEQLKDYVFCNYDGVNVTDKVTCDKKFGITNIISVEIKNRTEVNTINGYYCDKALPDGSGVVIYKYLDGNNDTRIWIQTEKEIPPVTDIWLTIGSAIGGILLVGILTTIAWKILMDIQDAREYRKFKEEAEANGYSVSENPLYKGPVVNINNPGYEHH